VKKKRKQNQWWMQKGFRAIADQTVAMVRIISSSDGGRTLVVVKWTMGVGQNCGE
jgi:hypothetical protein